MNSNHRNEPDFWPEDRYDRWGQYRDPQQVRENRHRWQPEQYQTDWQHAQRQAYQDNRNEYRAELEREDHRRGYGPGNNSNWQHGQSHSRSGYEHPRAGSWVQEDYHSRRFDRPDTYANEHNFPGSPYGRRNEHHNRGYEPRGTGARNFDYEHHRPHHTSLGIGAIGGSFTSYSASRSRTGAMGHARANNMLNREGPGMNSYSHGDINANSNW